VLAVPHMGNWELAGVAAQLFGAQLMIIARRQTNPLTNDYITRVRDSAGIETFLRESTSLAGIARGLRNGKVLAILPDLRAKADYIPCRFLGQEDVRIPAGMALFAREANVPIIPAYVVRVGWARHRWASFPPIQPDPSLDRDADFRRMTQYVIGCFDQAIREHPEDFFWFNGRWVLGEEGRAGVRDQTSEVRQQKE
jgi:Kdo2-lipid IVA lauroyltransferase/acyltransferase